MRRSFQIINPVRGGRAVVFTRDDREFEVELLNDGVTETVIRVRPFEDIYPWQEVTFHSICAYRRDGTLTVDGLVELGKEALKQYKEPSEWTDKRMSDLGRAEAMKEWRKLHAKLQADWEIARWQSPLDPTRKYGQREARARVRQLSNSSPDDCQCSTQNS